MDGHASWRLLQPSFVIRVTPPGGGSGPCWLGVGVASPGDRCGSRSRMRCPHDEYVDEYVDQSTMIVDGYQDQSVGSRPAAVITVRKAWASVARVTQRCRHAHSAADLVFIRGQAFYGLELLVDLSPMTGHRASDRSGTGCGL